MQQLFTSQLFIEPGFLSRQTCARWEKKVIKNLETFGPDISPSYGQMSAYYGMIEAGLNESYYRFAEKHNSFLVHNFPEAHEIINFMGSYILAKSGLSRDDVPVVPRDPKYFLKCGFKIQLRSFNIYNIHTDTEGLLAYPESIFDSQTRAYSCIISVKRTAQHAKRHGGDLDAWKSRYLAHQMDGFFKRDGVRARSKADRIRVPYETGSLIVFDSFMPHVVLPFKVRAYADQRITFLVHFNYRARTERNPFPHLEYWY